MKPDNTLTRQNGEPPLERNASSLACAQKLPRLAAPRRIEWSEDTGRLTRMGGLSYFATFLESTGFFADLVERCPLSYSSNNAPQKHNILGALLLSVLEGHTRYAHMASLAKASLDAEVLGMEKIPSEDSVRAALRRLADAKRQPEKARRWLDQSFDQLCEGCLHMPWVLDVDVTVKPLYGRQEGAVVGYNPGKPGRPSHAYHSFWVGHLRLCLGVQVRPGNETAGSHGLQPLMQWLERMPREVWPHFVRGDIGYGTQTWMSELEAKGLPYLFKLKQTAKVRKLVALCELKSSWESTAGKWEYCESRLQLNGWDCPRRVVLYRRVHVRRSALRKEETPALPGSCEQLDLLPLEVIEEGAVSWEYAFYVTTLDCPAGEVRAHYNPRGDNENSYDELKNQWGWGGFTLADLARSELMARFIALVYNWWSVYVKLVDEQVAREAITSRPMYLMHMAKAHTHQSTRTLVIFCAHSQAGRIRERLEAAVARLRQWAALTAEQLKGASVWARVIAHILLYHQTLGAGGTRAPPALATLS